MVDSHFEQIAELKKELAAQAKQISSLAQSLYLATQNLDEVAGYVYGVLKPANERPRTQK